jgi:hypothetical protein
MCVRLADIHRPNAGVQRARVDILVLDADAIVFVSNAFLGYREWY